ncbi:type III secretion system export apparatus subunit SctS [Trinickia fusca]|uniref:EscS/YscS/HrcS family type III secretion system export apparatus protein n=1 Tax=Trinickia fusca TaxID=2419777 RepID=A0A494X2K7_9BURK|nr:type III secretion system export apparatus subunit SctS [Trinickia fusca]RKP44570.1 EscS/YscS/HrcS family type III secretion system export apparatus protein [Trinickia fusca]
MEVENLIRLAMQAMMLCLYVSLPIVLIAAITGLLISFIQAITSLQDQTISYAIKLVVSVAAIAMLAPWGGSAILHFANELVQLAVPS